MVRGGAHSAAEMRVRRGRLTRQARCTHADPNHTL